MWKASDPLRKWRISTKLCGQVMFFTTAGRHTSYFNTSLQYNSLPQWQTYNAQAISKHPAAVVWFHRKSSWQAVEMVSSNMKLSFLERTLICLFQCQKVLLENKKRFLFFKKRIYIILTQNSCIPHPNYSPRIPRPPISKKYK